ncbi:fimbria/pilus outer membrane usher protein [Yersinia enterocolitica]|nr:fimbria/pilus outer membrane usher protein [Yersinia enterocolitica]EKN3460195.1 fimbrial biogenesis outer membrane usher protein [Yersinia enterocolitica]EKN3499030.1 fimbrial biogenesis outer membrane usher protein [Yersinia enterocolitica]EKN3972263.1 fimbrial biogenesis outer membrane usher protein [Yersinia enterocolitica]EKN4028932.1 fimbrial biogenesis outer membrane usher protein [Yersinia enterocolitica]EKN4061164.1 fimbrial biogenesis outer membrane usher protein [Yersinia enteroc
MNHLCITRYLQNKIDRLVNLPYKNSLGFTLTIISTTLFLHKSVIAAPLVNENNETEITSVEFNPDFIRGSGIDVARFMNENPVSPGVYDVMVIVNGKMNGKHSIRFESVAGESTAEPCFKLEQLDALGLRIELNGSTKIANDVKEAAKDQCYNLRDLIKGSSTRYNSGDFELSITVPQFNLVKHPRGYISPSLWDAGAPVGFLDYNSNVYGVFNGNRDDGAKSNSYNANIGLITGLNLGEWRLRKRLNTRWNNDGGAQTQNLYGFAATDVTSLKSQLTLGDSDTRGSLFEGFGLRGVQLASDNRMLAEGIRNYSPVIRGVAETNARVTVTQRGQTIYETVVTPGAFELADIGTMSYGGDLEMTVTESDGRTRSQRIPFSAPPMLLYQGVSQFDIAAGRLNDNTVNASPTIVQGAYYYGLGNTYTLYSGAQLAENYSSVGIGNAFNTQIGGISFDVTHARSELSGDHRSSGNSYKVDYTKYVGETDTNLTLAAYRYSSNGFYTFREASQDHYGSINANSAFDSRTRNRLSVSVSQRVADNMSLNLNSSFYSYWGGQDASQQYAVTFNHSLRYFSYALTAMRTSNSSYISSYDNSSNNDYQNSYMASISIPLGGSIVKRPLFNTLYSMASHDDAGNTLVQMNASGSQGEQSELGYGVGTSYSSGNDIAASKTVTGNMSYKTGVGQYGMTASANNSSSRQLSASANGSVVAHQGGVTIGPRLGDAPFAIVHAEGAAGAKLFNGNGATIDSRGYAIMPSMTAYRENTVAIDYKELPDSVDVLESQKVVVPRTGAMIPVAMKTITGAPLVLIVRDENKEFLPIGTDLLDADGVSQGIVGQGGMAFIRGWGTGSQPLQVISNGGKDKCRIHSGTEANATAKTESTHITQLEVVCLRG